MAWTNRAIYDTVLSDVPHDVALKRIAQLLKESGVPEKQVDTQAAMVLLPWFVYFLRYDPSADLRKIDIPVLALIGSLDLQVPADPNLKAIRSALSAAPTDDVTVRGLPGLNHLFQPATKGTIDEYSTIETTLDPSVLEIITVWINQRFGTSP